MLPNWGFFGVFLTMAELAIGVGLILGLATRLAAVGALLLIIPIWIMLWPSAATCGSTPPKTSSPTS